MFCALDMLALHPELLHLKIEQSTPTDVPTCVWHGKEAHRQRWRLHTAHSNAAAIAVPSAEIPYHVLIVRMMWREICHLPRSFSTIQGKQIG